MLIALSGCAHGSVRKSASPPSADSSTSPSSTAPATSAVTTTPSTSSTTSPTASPPTSTTAPAAFVSTVSPTSSAELPYSYRAGCPVAPDQLRRLTLTYFGFDQATHVGTMIVNAAVTQDVIKVFATLYAERFPIHHMVPVDAFKGSDPASMAADNTSGFNCRNAVALGPPQWSVHAYGEAIDVNTVENPYIEGGMVQPAAGGAYLDRTVIRPGMAVRGGPLVIAFASVGWSWGGRWATPDYQHFSKTGG
jgi:hypothetical protein